jgi:methionyl-tRNA synthetase
LINYISALGYDSEEDGLYKKFWPADLHLIGKEINRFHSIIWPAMLMAANLPLPKKVFAHGWLTVNGEKISKSAGNAIDPRLLMQAYGKDAVKYYLLRDITFGKDGDFSEDHLIQRINSDLANDLGNLLHRTTAMSIQNFNGNLAAPYTVSDEPVDAEFVRVFQETKTSFFEKMDKFQFTQALEGLWGFIGLANKYIDLTEPWKLAKIPEKTRRLQRVLWNLAEALKNIALAIKPFMVSTSETIFSRLGFSKTEWENVDFKQFDWCYDNTYSLKEGAPLFPRLDVKELKKVIHMANQEQKPEETKTEPLKTEEQKQESQENIIFVSYEHFSRIQLKTALIKEAYKIEKSRKLVRLLVDVGEEHLRQIVAGIAQYYEPEKLVGKMIVIVSNLEPAKLMGLDSCGMLLAAKDGVNLKLLTVDGEIQPGASVS